MKRALGRSRCGTNRAATCVRGAYSSQRPRHSCKCGIDVCGWFWPETRRLLGGCKCALTIISWLWHILGFRRDILSATSAFEFAVTSFSNDVGQAIESLVKYTVLSRPSLL